MESRPVFGIRSASTGELQLAWLDNSSVVATISGRDLQASLPVYLPKDVPPGIDDLVQTLRSCAADWRGWAGPRDWRSIEGELSISVEHDRLGHAAFEVRLHQPYGGWTATNTIVVEVGQLDALAAEASAFAAAR